MRALAVCILLVVAALAVWLWGAGGTELVGQWAAGTQRDVQNAMAASLRAARAGDAGALLTLWGLCFSYGFVHAAGPGHGKMVIGGYGMGARVSVRRLVGLAALSSVAQALVAIVFVTFAVVLLDWSRERLTDVADQTMAPLSYALIAGVGAWLLARGVRKGLRLLRPHHTHSHGHDVCADCGHVHAPTMDQAASVRTWRDTVAIVAAIAIRPCTGAIFLLILTYALGLYWAGVLGVLFMGLGTAALTAFVAFAAVGARESALAQAVSGRGTAMIMAGVEVLVGALIVALSLQFLMRFV